MQCSHDNVSMPLIMLIVWYPYQHPLVSSAAMTMHLCHSHYNTYVSALWWAVQSRWKGIMFTRSRILGNQSTAFWEKTPPHNFLSTVLSIYIIPLLQGRFWYNMVVPWLPLNNFSHYSNEICKQINGIYIVGGKPRTGWNEWKVSFLETDWRTCN